MSLTLHQFLSEYESLSLPYQHAISASDDHDASLQWNALQKSLTSLLERGDVVYPATPFAVLKALQPDDVKVVILGQDPYHGEDQAHGYAFSVPENTRIPPSLRNIFKECARDFNMPIPAHGNLEAWVRQGVLLLNTVLTVGKDSAGSHGKLGWQAVTTRIIRMIAQQPQPKAYLLWGGWAHQYESMIREVAQGPYLILKSNHPSPLSANRPPLPFIGSGQFSQTNKWLEDQGLTPIDWSLS